MCGRCRCRHPHCPVALNVEATKRAAVLNHVPGTCNSNTHANGAAPESDTDSAWSLSTHSPRGEKAFNHGPFSAISRMHARACAFAELRGWAHAGGKPNVSFLAGFRFDIWVPKLIWLHMLRTACICGVNLRFDRHKLIRRLMNVRSSSDMWYRRHVLQRSSSWPLNGKLTLHRLVDLIETFQKSIGSDVCGSTTSFC